MENGKWRIEEVFCACGAKNNIHFQFSIFNLFISSLNLFNSPLSSIIRTVYSKAGGFCL